MTTPHPSGYASKQFTLIKKRIAARKAGGFLLVEVMVGIALFALFLLSAGLVLLNGQESTEASGDRVRATFLAERSLEAARDIRGGGGFAALTAGQHGVTLSPSGQWQWSGVQATATGNFLTSLTIQNATPDIRRLIARSTWKHGFARSGAVLITTELANWRTTCGVGNWAAMPTTPEGSYSPGGTPLFSAVAVAGSTAFIAADTSPGIYILDITTTASPRRIGATFSLEGGYVARAVAVKGKRLYVLTTDPNKEIQLFNISSPSSPSRLATFDLDGSALGTSLWLAGDILLVGAQSDSTPEVHALDTSNSGTIVPFDPALVGNITGTVNAVAVTGTSAYLATTDINQELILANTAATGLDPIQIQNLGNNLAGLSLAISGSGLLLGQAKGSANLEFFNIQGGGLSSFPTFPRTQTASGSVMGVAMDTIPAYGFVAADSGRKALQIFSLRTTPPSEVVTYNATAPAKGRGVYYDVIRDRLYLLTTDSFLIFQPDPSTPSRPCS